MTFGFIGAGNMASAIIKGMTLGGGGYDPQSILVSSKSRRSAEELAQTCGVIACAENAEVVQRSDVLILAVKPHILEEILPQLHSEIQAKAVPPLIISIAAGKTLADLARLLPEGVPIVRVMPNINAKIRSATSGICANGTVTAEQREIAKQMFSAIGAVIDVDEKQFGIFSVLAGSAPAFAYLYIDALARAAVRAGMSKGQAVEIAAATVLGSARMVLESGEHPWALIDQVCSPGGTTIEGILSLQASGFETALADAFDAVLEKNERL